MSQHPTQIWWTAAEIAAAGLPGMPTSKFRINALAARLNWRSQPDFARHRIGRGGGWKYHWQLFPMEAQKRLLSEMASLSQSPKRVVIGRDEAWERYDRLPNSTKKKAAHRLAIIQAVEVLVNAGGGWDLSVDQISQMNQITGRTIWNWLGMIDGVRPDDRLAYLAPKHRIASRRVNKAACSSRFMDLLKGDYLRLDGPSFVSAYERVVEICQAEGREYLTPRTARRRFNQMVPRVTQVFARKGEPGLVSCFPAQIRDRTGMAALEGVNADCHKMDVFVQWPGEDKPARAQIVAFQDIYSGKFLSWRIDSTPNKLAVMAAFGDMIDEFGIPEHCLFDNGREFANKWLTGGTPTRFRFKIHSDDPLGVLPMLGIKIHWATPAHGQAKPIERAFRDFADHIAKDPRFAGAYTGNKPDAKPEDYGSRAIPIDEFVRVVGEGIARHNARLGRLSDTARGRSFDETFAESYERTPIRRATDEQRRLWLMAQTPIKLQPRSGQVTVHGNKYWSDWMNEFAGIKMVARFNPEDLHSGLHIYDLEGTYLGYAGCREKVGFFDLTGAKEEARKRAAIKRTERKLLAQQRNLKPLDVAAALDAISPADPAKVEAKVLHLQTGQDRDPAARVERPEWREHESADDQASQAEFVADFMAEKSRREAQDQGEETPREMFRRAQDIERRSATGEAVGEAEAHWLAGFRLTPIYKSEKLIWEDFGDEMYL